MTTDSAGRVVTSVRKAMPGAGLRTRLVDGVLQSTVQAVEPLPFPGPVSEHVQ